MKICGCAVGKSEGSLISRDSCIWSGPLNFILRTDNSTLFCADGQITCILHPQIHIPQPHGKQQGCGSVSACSAVYPFGKTFFMLWIQSTNHFSERMNIAFKCTHYLFAARIGALRVAKATSSASSVLMVLLPCSGHTLR